MSSHRPKGVVDAAEASGEDFVPWGRLPGDPPAAWKAFQLYRDMGLDRSLPQLALKLKCSQGNVRWFSMRYEWRARVQAYDAHCDEQYRREVAKDRKAIAHAHAAAAKLMRVRAVEALKDMPLAVLLGNPSACVALIKEATRLEAQLYGVSRLDGEGDADRGTPTDVYLDARPRGELIALTRNALAQMVADEAREQSVASDAETVP